MADLVQVGRALWEAHVDRSKLKPDLDGANADIAAAGAKGEQAATASATTTVAKIGGIARQAATTLALGAGAMFGVATKLASEGETAMARFKAETGATQQEAEDALDAMNRLAGQNLQSFGVVADVVTQVRTQMGLTGAAAEDMANRILKFSTATGQDAVEAVKAFDDAGDAWNMTADEQKQLMDELIVSHQRYGGTISESEALLNQLAPTLQAANMNWQDAVGLLNLFNHAGVGAEAAATGINRALQKVKSPEELQQLIKDVAATTDPFERARKAADLFGNRAGPKLANALADSHGDLAAFKIDVADAAGATDQAASDIQSTFPNQVRMAFNSALGAARGFATDFGPALLGASSLASIGVSFASALKLDDALKGAWTKAAANESVQAAAQAAGGLLGKAFMLGATVGLAALLVDAWVHALQDAKTQLESDDSVAGLDMVDMLQSRAPRWAQLKVAAQKQALELGHDALVAFNKAWNDAIAGGLDTTAALEAGKAAVEPFKQGFKDGLGSGGSWAVGPETHASTDAGFRDLGQSGAKVFVDNFLTGVQDSHYAQGVSDQVAHMSSSIPTAPSRQLGVHFGEQFVVGFKSTRDQAKSEWQQYLDDLAHPNRGQKTVGWIVGKLTGEQLADGLRSSDPVVRHSAEQEQQNLRVQLQGMLDDGYTIGKKTLAKLGLGIVDGKIVAVSAAKGAKTDVNDALDNTSGVYGYGEDLVNRWAAGMAHAGINAATIAQGIVHRVGGVFLDDVPIPADAPEHIRRIGEYGGHFIDRWVGGMWDRGDAAARSAELLGARIAGSFSGFGPSGSLVGSDGVIRHDVSGTVQVRLTGDTIAAARAQGASWDDVGRMAAAASQASTAHLRTIGARQYS